MFRFESGMDAQKSKWAARFPLSVLIRSRSNNSNSWNINKQGSG